MVSEYLHVDDFIHLINSNYDFRDVYKLSIPKFIRFRTHWIVKLNPLRALIYLRLHLHYGKVQFVNEAIV